MISDVMVTRNVNDLIRLTTVRNIKMKPVVSFKGDHLETRVTASRLYDTHIFLAWPVLLPVTMVKGGQMVQMPLGDTPSCTVFLLDPCYSYLFPNVHIY